MQYDSSQIKFKNIPRLDNLVNRNCCRTYLYFFSDRLPQQNDIDQIASSLAACRREDFATRIKVIAR